MAKFLTTSEINTWLERIIDQAQKQLILVSPYLQVNPKIKKRLQAKDHEIMTKVESRISKAFSILKGGDATTRMQIQIIHRKDTVKDDEISWLQDLSSIETISLNNLHAKCYLNEDHALLTSMNLYQHSQVHNYEMGILAPRSGGWGDREGELYRAIVKHVKELIMHAKMENPIASATTPASDTQANSANVPTAPRPPKQSPSPNRKTATPTLERPHRSHCIRCDDPIATESQPFCDTDWGTWNQHKKDSWPGRVCLFCEAPKKFKRQPLCLECYNKHKSILNKYKSILGL